MARERNSPQSTSAARAGHLPRGQGSARWADGLAILLDVLWSQGCFPCVLRSGFSGSFRHGLGGAPSLLWLA